MSISHPALLGAAALVVWSGVLTGQQPITYAPGARRYHLRSVVTRVQEVQGQKTTFTITNEQRVTVRLSPRGTDTLDFTYTLDSSRLSSEPAAELPDVTKMQGTTISGSMSRSGHVYAYRSSLDDDSPDARSLVEGMSRFLMPLPKDAHVGSTWADTAHNSVRRDGNDIDMRTITSSTILGDTVYRGEPAWRVQRKSVLSLTGNQNQMGRTLHVEGTGDAAGMYYLSRSGVYLGSSATQNMKMTVTLPGGGISVPVTQTVVSIVELLPDR
jgi:hypothetical protein